MIKAGVNYASLRVFMSVQHFWLISLSTCLQVVVPLYYAAFRYSATKLLANCCNFLLNHYDKVDDPGESCESHVTLK